MKLVPEFLGRRAALPPATETIVDALGDPRAYWHRPRHSCGCDGLCRACLRNGREPWDRGLDQGPRKAPPEWTAIPANRTEPKGTFMDLDLIRSDVADGTADAAFFRQHCVDLLEALEDRTARHRAVLDEALTLAAALKLTKEAMAGIATWIKAGPDGSVDADAISTLFNRAFIAARNTLDEFYGEGAGHVR